MDIIDLEEYSDKITSIPATLLWEYGFEFTDEDFKNFKELINTENIFPEEEDLLVALYLYFIAQHDYKEGNFWEYAEYIDNSAHKEAFERFNRFLKKYNLFQLKEKPGPHRYVQPILIHAVLPAHYAENFLSVVKDIYKDYLQKYKLVKK